MHMVVGNPTLDIQEDGRKKIGGTVTYALRALDALGVDAQGVAKAELAVLARLSRSTVLPVHQVRGACTAQFKNTYDGAGNREQHLEMPGEALRVLELPSEINDATSVHFGPVFHDFSPDLTEHFPSARLRVLTPQGWLRGVTYSGRIVPHVNLEALKMTLAQMDWVIVSEEDIYGLMSASDLAGYTKRLVVTQGRLGALLFESGEVRQVPVKRVFSSDPTGAGDIFAAGLTSALLDGRGQLEAIAKAHEVVATLLGDESQAKLETIGADRTNQPDFLYLQST